MKKKILGMPIVVFVLGILLIGGASALIVNYLSNTATATVKVDSPMVVKFANIVDVDSNGAFTSLGWTDGLTLAGTTGLSTSTIGVSVKNNADTAIVGKWLQLTVSTGTNSVSCGDITSLQFMDTATPTQIAKGYQELSSLCQVVGSNVVYNIDINSLAPGTEYLYPAKITFGLVEPATYTFSAQMLNSIV
jgi:hypothetical protein